MAENIQLLINEMRANHDTIVVIDKRLETLQTDHQALCVLYGENRQPLLDEREKAIQRKKILDETLNIMVKEGKTMLEAKMLAPERIDHATLCLSFSWGDGIFRLESRPNWRTRFLRWAFIKLGGR